MFFVHLYHFFHQLHSGNFHRGDLAIIVHFLRMFFGCMWVLHIKIHFRILKKKKSFVFGIGNIPGVNIAGLNQHTFFALQEVREQRLQRRHYFGLWKSMLNKNK